MSFVERTISSLVNALERALDAEELAKGDGLLQRLDPRIKVVGILALVVATATAHKLWVIGALGTPCAHLRPLWPCYWP